MNEMSGASTKGQVAAQADDLEQILNVLEDELKALSARLVPVTFSLPTPTDQKAQVTPEAPLCLTAERIRNWERRVHSYTQQVGHLLNSLQI